MAELYDVMSTLRAVRKLRPDPIPDDVLERVLQAACWAPTGGNTQPWRVVVVTEPDTKRALQDIYAPEWERYAVAFLKMMADRPADELASWERVAAAGDHLAANLHQVPAILMFCANPAMMAITDAKLDRVSMVGGGSVYPAVQNAMLACVQEGLGCTLTTLHCTHEDEVKAVLGIPDGWATVGMVPIGYPVGKGHGSITRLPPSEMADRDRFGAGWP
ncbi:nitroreductase family protein [Ilumatobacter nonamiensis]|uniref:nitroreductase family protein n=1 Tax=Ilumatobacter nonamiensis TaxID=467093 RepID=UPI0003483AC9|nr:nitroreductase family protein [Ilumatobacter nonamiensis]